jgi:hypothetical protein
MKLEYIFVLVCSCPIMAQADIYKAIDADGHVTYSNSPMKGGKKLNLEPLPTMLPYKDTSGNFPKVDSETQKNRDDTRRKILQDELANEEKLLAESKKNLEEASPEVYTGIDGKTYRNVEKYDAKVKALQDQVDLHEKNVTALKTELSKLR